MTYWHLHCVFPSIHVVCGHEYKALPSYQCRFFHIPSEECECLPIFLSAELYFCFLFFIPAKLYILKHQHRTIKSLVAWTHTRHLKTSNSSSRIDSYWLNHISSKLRKNSKSHTTQSSDLLKYACNCSQSKIQRKLRTEDKRTLGFSSQTPITLPPKDFEVRASESYISTWAVFLVAAHWVSSYSLHCIFIHVLPVAAADIDWWKIFMSVVIL